LLTPTYDRDTASYLFSHDELARIARESLPAERRAVLHARLAAALAASEGVSHSLVATHYEAAGQSAEAHRHAVLAADAALGLYDSAAASTLLLAAARHAPSPAGLAAVRMRLAELAEKAGHFEDAEALCDLALEWFEGSDDPVQAIRLKRMRTLVRMQRGRGARETLDALFALVDGAILAGADAERASILLVASQMLERLGEAREAQRVAEECVQIAEQCADPVLLCDSYNRLALCLSLRDAPRAQALYARALELIVPLNDVFRRVRVLNNMGNLALAANHWAEARVSLEAAADFARTAGLLDPWARAALNLGVLAFRSGDFAQASRMLNEALRLGAEVQQTEIQLIATYNLAHLAREVGEHPKAAATYELAMELAERIGQFEVQVCAMAAMALSWLAIGDVARATELHARLQPMVSHQSEWFKNREFVEALSIHLAARKGDGEAYAIFASALDSAEERDVFGASWLIAEVGPALVEIEPTGVREMVRRFAGRPEVLESPSIRDRFGVLMLDTADNC
jgi:tetratricopeptide (TPR) repeat protein